MTMSVRGLFWVSPLHKSSTRTTRNKYLLVLTVLSYCGAGGSCFSAFPIFPGIVFIRTFRVFLAIEAYVPTIPLVYPSHFLRWVTLVVYVMKADRWVV